MEEQTEKINKILSYIYLGFNSLFIIAVFISCRASKKAIKTLKIKLFILIIIDTIKYLQILYNSNFDEQLYYELIITGIYSLQIYLFISIFIQTLSLIRSRIIQYMEDHLSPFQIACFSFLLVFPYDKLINYEPKIIIIVQNIVCFIIIIVFYSSLYNQLFQIKKSLNKKYVKKLQVTNNLILSLRLTLCLLFYKIIVNIIMLLFVEQEYQDFLKLPLDFVIYLKYFNYAVFAMTIFQFERMSVKKNIDEIEKILKKKNELN